MGNMLNKGSKGPVSSKKKKFKAHKGTLPKFGFGKKALSGVQPVPTKYGSK